MASFEDYGGNNQTGICPRCRENPTAGSTGTRLNEFREESSSRYRQISSRQVNMCESCCIEVYDILTALLDKEANGGTRRPQSAAARTRKTTTNDVEPRRRRRARAGS